MWAKEGRKLTLDCKGGVAEVTRFQIKTKVEGTQLNKEL